MKRNKQIKFLLFILLIPVISGCAGIGRYSYYSPHSDKGNPKRFIPVHAYAHYMSKDGPPERMEFQFQHIDFEIHIWDNDYDTYFFGPCFSPKVCLPIIPFFPISLLMPDKMTSNGLELSLTITRLGKDLNVNLDKIKIIAQNPRKEFLPQLLYKDIQDRNIKLPPKQTGYHYLDLTYDTTEEVENIELVIDGLFIDDQKIDIPRIYFYRKTEWVWIAD